MFLSISLRLAYKYVCICLEIIEIALFKELQCKSIMIFSQDAKIGMY